jgi:RNA polymerase sigma factor (sigma-70 family)
LFLPAATPTFIGQFTLSKHFMKSAVHSLTDREKQVLELLSKGLTYAAIGERLEVSAETVKKHLQHIYRKLKAQNKIEALINAKML